MDEKQKPHHTLWRIPASGGTPQPLAAVGEDASNPSFSRREQRLAYERSSEDWNIWRMEVSNGQGTSPIPVISSTRNENSPQISPDGQRILFCSDRSGNFEIWVCNADGSHPVQLTNYGGPNTGTPRWSPDGSLIAFGSTDAGTTDIDVVSSNGGIPRRLTADPSDDIRPYWSKNGRWIYFGSNRSGD